MKTKLTKLFTTLALAVGLASAAQADTFSSWNLSTTSTAGVEDSTHYDQRAGHMYGLVFKGTFDASSLTGINVLRIYGGNSNDIYLKTTDDGKFKITLQKLSSSGSYESEESTQTLTAGSHVFSMLMRRNSDHVLSIIVYMDGDALVSLGDGSMTFAGNPLNRVYFGSTSSPNNLFTGYISNRASSGGTDSTTMQEIQTKAEELFPALTEHTATVSTNTKWSEIVWSPAIADPTLATLSLTVENDAVITMDETPVYYSMTVTGTMTINTDSLVGADLAKNAVYGAPYSHWYFPKAVTGTVKASTVPTMPTDYTITEDTASGFGARFVVTAPSTAMFGSVSMNIHNGTALTGDGNHGLFPVALADWGNIQVGNGRTVTHGNLTFTMSSSVTGYGLNNTPPDMIQKQYMDDSTDERTITVSGMTAKGYANYRVIVYFSTDTANTTFAAMSTTAGGVKTYYAGPTTTTTVGVTVKGKQAGWGESGSNHNANALGEGVNALVTDVLTADSVVLGFDKDDGGRATPCAIQIVEVGVVAMIGSNTYASLAAAESAVTEGQTIQLVNDCTDTLTTTKSFTLDLNGRTLSGNIVNNGSVTMKPNSGTFSGTMSGSGTLVYDSSVLTTYPTTGPAGLTDPATWTGTVWFKGYEFKPCNFFANFANASSKIKLTSCKGYAPQSELDNGTIEFVLEDDGSTAAWDINNGYGGGNYHFQMGKLSGTGTFKGSNNPAQNYAVKDGSAFAGTITLGNNGVILTFGTSALQKSSGNGGYIRVDSGYAANVADGKTWTASGGFEVNGTIGGAGTLSGNVTFGSGAEIDARAAQLTVTGTLGFGTDVKVRVATAPTAAAPVKVLNKTGSGAIAVVKVYVGTSDTAEEGQFKAVYQDDGVYVTPYATHALTVDADTTWEDLVGSTSIAAYDEVTVAANGHKITFTEKVTETYGLTISDDVTFAADDALYRDGCWEEAVATFGSVTISGTVTSVLKDGFYGAFSATSTAVKLRAQNKEVISINIAGGSGGGSGASSPTDNIVSGSDYYGIAPTLGDSWNNIDRQWQSGGDQTITITAPNAFNGQSTVSRPTMSLSATGKNTWQCGDIANKFLRGYLDDGDGVTVLVHGIPYTKYDVIVYATSDDAGIKLAPITINGKQYTYANGAVTEGSSVWGTGKYATPEIGQNALRICDCTSEELTINATRVTGTNGGRATLCAVQVVCTGDIAIQSKYVADVTAASVTWTDGTDEGLTSYGDVWANGTLSTLTLTNKVASTLTFNPTETLTGMTFSVVSEADSKLTIPYASLEKLSFGILNFSNAYGKVAINLDGVTEGYEKKTILSGTLSGSTNVTYSSTGDWGAYADATGIRMARTANDMTRTNPVVSTETKTFARSFFGSTDASWNTLANWRKPENGLWMPATTLPGISGGDYPTILIDGDDSAQDAVSVDTLEGYSIQYAFLNGAKVTASSLTKMQAGTGVNQFIWVDEDSSFTVNAIGSGSNWSPVDMCIASADGITLPGITTSAADFTYYFKGNGSAKFTGALTAGTYTIKQIDLEVGATAKDRRHVEKKTLVTFGSGTTVTFAKADDFVVTLDNAEVEATYIDTVPACTNEVGTYTIATESDGVYAYVVQYADDWDIVDPLSATLTSNTNFTEITTWTDYYNHEFTNPEGTHAYKLTCGEFTATQSVAFAEVSGIEIASGTLLLDTTATIGTETYTVDGGATLKVKTSGLKGSQVTNNGTIRFEGGDATNPITITGNGGFGFVTLGADTYVKNTVDNNYVHNVTGEGATSCYALGKASGGVGFTTAAFTNLTIVSDCAAGERVWMERMTYADIRLVANTTIYLSDMSPTVLSLSGAGAVTMNGSKTLTINAEAACEYSGASVVPFTIGGTALMTLSGAYTGALTVNEGGQVKLTGSAAPTSITSAGTVTFDYGAETTKTVALTGAGSVNVDSGLVILKGYRDFVTVGDGAKVGFIVDINDCGSFTPPAGMTTDQIELYKVSGSSTVKVEATVEDGKFVFEWGYKGANAWLEYEFNTNLVNTGSADTTPLQFDGTHCFTGDEYAKTVVTQEIEGVETVITNWSVKAASAPWRNVTFPSEVTVVMYGKMMKTSNACQIGIGSTTGGSKYSLFLAAGDVDKEEVVLGYAKEKDTTAAAGVQEHGVLCTMSVPNAQTTDHLYAFTMQQVGDDTVVNIYLDGEVLQPYTFQDATVTLGSGIQLGSIHGGVGASQDWPTDFGFKRSTEVETGATLDFLRVYNVVLNDTVMKAIADDYPYISPNGSYSRTMTTSLGLWEAAQAWENELTLAKTNTPAAKSELKVTAASTGSMMVLNLDKDVVYESLTVSAGGYLSIVTNMPELTSSPTSLGKVIVSGKLSVNDNAMINYNAVDIAGTKVAIAANKTLYIDFGGIDLSKYYEDATLDVTGVVSGGTGAGIGPVLPAAVAGRTATFAMNESTQHYELRITMDGEFTGTVPENGTWDDIVWKAGDTVVAEPDWSILETAKLVIPAGAHALEFNKNLAFTNLVVTGSGSCTFTKGSGVTVSARTLDVSAAAGFTVGTENLITVTEELTLGEKLRTSGIAHNSVVMTAPADCEPIVDVVVDGVAGGELLNNEGALTLYMPAPTVFTVTSITSRAQTNFNGSAVTVAYSAYSKGDYDSVTVKLSINNHEYLYDASKLEATGGTITFRVANEDAAAGNVASAVLSVVGSGTTKSGAPDLAAYDNTAFLYQGALDAATTNEWFSTSANGATLSQTGGAWNPTPTAAENKIVIQEDDESGEYEDVVFEPETASAQAVIVDETVSFDAALDDVNHDLSTAQMALRVVTAGDDQYRFCVLVGGAWVTNDTVAVTLGTEYALRQTLDYRTIPGTISYAVKVDGEYVTLASGAGRADKSALADVLFNGSGKIAVMTGSNLVDSVDASLVADADGNRYANVTEAFEAGETELQMLWDISWTPGMAAGEWTLAANGHKLYWDAEDGLFVTVDGEGNYRVITSYYEAMNLLIGASSVTTNKFTFFTNALDRAETEASFTNFYLLRDVELPEGVTIHRDTWFNGESNILSGAALAVESGKTFTIEGGHIGVPSFTGAALKGGRFTDESTNYWKDVAAAGDYTFSKLAVVERPDYEWQLIKAAVAPKAGEQLLPVKTAEGESVSVVVSNDWATIVTGTDKPAEQSEVFSVKQANGLTRLDNEILGLAKDGEVEKIDIPVILPVQAAKTDTVTFSLGNVKQSSISASGARVTYRVFSSKTPGGKDGAVSSPAAPTVTTDMALPTDGVLYYTIEVDTGAVK